MSFGEELKRERELREIGLREVAEATKIQARYLEALEANDFSELPGGVFNRGFVRAYAQYIGVDPEGMVDAYLMEVQSQGGSEAAETADSVRQRLEQRSGPIPVESQPSPKLIIAAAAALLVIVAGFLIWWFAIRTSAEPKNSSAATPGLLQDKSKSDDSVELPVVQASSPPSRNQAHVVAGLRSTGTQATAVVTRIFVDTSTSGRIHCDDRQVEKLEGILPGTRLELACSRHVILDADDASALRVAIGDEEPRQLGPEGQALRNHTIDIAQWLRDQPPTPTPDNSAAESPTPEKSTP